MTFELTSELDGCVGLSVRGGFEWGNGTICIYLNLPSLLSDGVGDVEVAAKFDYEGLGVANSKVERYRLEYEALEGEAAAAGIVKEL